MRRIVLHARFREGGRIKTTRRTVTPRFSAEAYRRSPYFASQDGGICPSREIAERLLDQYETVIRLTDLEGRIPSKSEIEAHL